MRILVCLACVLLLFAAGAAASTILNDDCSTAAGINYLPWSWLGSTAEATADYEFSDCFTGGVMGVWFRYMALENGAVAFDTDGSSFDTILTAYRGQGCSALSYLTCDDDGGAGYYSSLRIPVFSGMSYYILASGHGTKTGTLSLHARAIGPPVVSGFDPTQGSVDDMVTIYGSDFLGTTGTQSVWFNGVPAVFETVSDTVIQTWVPPDATSGQISVETEQGTGVSEIIFNVVPQNDQCTGATPIYRLPYSNQQDTTYATSDGDPTPCDPSFGKGVWYTYYAIDSGTLVADTMGSNFDTILAAYHGECPNNLHEVTCNDDSVIGGNLSLITFPVVQGTMYWLLAGGHDGASGDLHLNVAVAPATIDNFSPPSGPTFTTVTILGTGFADTTAVNFNQAASQFAVISENEIRACVPVGATTGRIEVVTPTYSVTSDNDFVVEHPPFNDHCEDATVIGPQSVPYTNTQDTTLATSDGDPSLSCDYNAGNGVWYAYTPPADRLVVAHTYGSSYQTSIGVYGGACGSLEEIACSDTGPGQAARVQFTASADMTYYFLIAGKQGATGSLTFSLHVDSVLPRTDGWSSNSGGSWDDPSNWASGQVPGPNTDVVIPAPDSGIIIALDSSTTVRSLILGSGSGSARSTLLISPRIELVSTEGILIAARGRLAVLGGALTVTGTLENRGIFTLGSPTYLPPNWLSHGTSASSSFRTLAGTGTTSEMGLVNILGGYIGQAGSSLTVRIASEDLYGRMSVNGQAKLTGTTLNIELLNGYVPAPDTPFDILVANHGVCESPGGCSSPFCMICPSCSYGICGSFSEINVIPSLSQGHFDQQVTSGPSPYFWCVTTSRGTLEHALPAQGEMKAMADGTSADVLLGIVTAVQPSANYLYLQDPNRSAALRIDTTSTGQTIAGKAVQFGDVLQVGGIMGTREILGTSSERQLEASNLTRLTQVGLGALTPLALKCGAVGGAAIEPYCPGVEHGVGLNNLGLFVKIVGRVTSMNGTDVIVDDNPSATPDPTHGVMINLPGGAPGMRVGSFVCIVGVVEGYVPGGATADRQFIRPNAAVDVQVLAY